MTRRARVGVVGVLAALVACQRTPDADLTLRRAPPATLTVTAAQATLRTRAPAGTPWRVTCDTPAGPVVREGRAGQRGDGAVPPGRDVDVTEVVPTALGGVYGCAAQVGGTRVTAVPAGPAPAAPSAPPARPAPSPPPAARSGRVTVTPPAVRIGRREPWSVRADLRDAAGAPVPDGTLVTLRGRGPGGAEVVAARSTANGEAQWLLTPDRAGRWTVTLEAGPWRAQAEAVARTALLGGVPPLLWVGQQVTVGPLTWEDGALPDDGTPVEASALDDQGGTRWSGRAFTVLGRVQLTVPDVPQARTLRLSVAGATATVPWARP